MGSNIAGGMSAGTYTTNNPDLCAFVANDSNSLVVVVDTMANASKYISKRAELKKVRHVIVYMEDVPESIGSDGYVLSFRHFLQKGQDIADAVVDARLESVRPESCASLIYTSGTTGNPKGVMVSHDSLLFSANAGMFSMEVPEQRHHSLSYLPLSHIAAQMLDIVAPIFYTGRGSCWTLYFARPVVMKGSLPISLQGVQPTLFFGVPRVWEKFVEGIRNKAKASPATGLKKRLVDWAKGVGTDNCRECQIDGSGVQRRGTHMAERLVFAKVRQALGLTRCTSFFTGAAPIARETLEFLASLGIYINEVYGMSETCGIGSSSSPHRFQFGSCGVPTMGTELRLDFVQGRDNPGEGEICFRGRHVMIGYINNQAKTSSFTRVC